MSDLNQPPFYVGQKVVCVNPAKFDRLKKDATYTVEKIYKCSCGHWLVNVGVYGGVVCSVCGSNLPADGMNANLFRPIDELYADMTASIAASSKQTNEVPDKVLKPETVNN